MRIWFPHVLLISAAVSTLFILWSSVIEIEGTPTTGPLQTRNPHSVSTKPPITASFISEPIDAENTSPHYWDARSAAFEELVPTNVRLRAALWNELFLGTKLDPLRLPSVDDFADAVTSIRQCRALGPEAIAYIANYLHLHHQRKLPSRLIYSCESNKKKHFCGGMGDRFRGIISAFYMALLSNRRFELYSPVPIPLQKYLKPNLVNWVPSTAAVGRPTVGQSAVDEAMATIHSDLSMMLLKKHSSYIRKLDGLVQPLGPSAEPLPDLRLQTNSVGIDMFLSSRSSPNLYKSKQQMFEGASYEAERVKGKGYLQADSSYREEVAALNISTYFGCLYEVLFSPSEKLLKAISQTIGDANRLVQTSVIKDSLSSASLTKRATLMAINEHDSTDDSKTLSVLKRNWDSIVFGAPSWVQQGSQEHGHRRSVLFLYQPYISVQVRVGGPLATGMKEPYRTPPEAFGEFFSMIDAILGGSKEVSNSKPWNIFVSSDAETFINLTVARYSGPQRVAFVNGKEAFLHTDTLNLGDINAARWRHVELKTKENAFFLTLVNNYILGLGRHMVMAQSGFGDTAYWRMQRDASCLFVDMTTLKHAWQHHLSYEHQRAGDTDGFLSKRLSQQEGLVPRIGYGRAPARAVLNRVLYFPDHLKRNTSFYR